MEPPFGTRGLSHAATEDLDFLAPEAHTSKRFFNWLSSSPLLLSSPSLPPLFSLLSSSLLSPDLLLSSPQISGNGGGTGAWPAVASGGGAVEGPVGASGGGGVGGGGGLVVVELGWWR